MNSPAAAAAAVQVKLRGVRVEPAEVEAALCAAHWLVVAAAVRKAPSAEALDAYVVLQPAAAAAVAGVPPAGAVLAVRAAAVVGAALRLHCTARLPIGLVPHIAVTAPKGGAVIVLRATQFMSVIVLRATQFMSVIVLRATQFMSTLGL